MIHCSKCLAQRLRGSSNFILVPNDDLVSGANGDNVREEVHASDAAPATHLAVMYCSLASRELCGFGFKTEGGTWYSRS